MCASPHAHAGTHPRLSLIHSPLSHAQQPVPQRPQRLLLRRLLLLGSRRSRRSAPHRRPQCDAPCTRRASAAAVHRLLPLPLLRRARRRLLLPVPQLLLAGPLPRVPPLQLAQRAERRARHRRAHPLTPLVQEACQISSTGHNTLLT